MPVRDSGGSFTLNNPDDGTPIREMFKLRDGLLLITEKCTYRMQVADQIDPERKNPALPHNFQQKLFDHGTGSELLCRSLLQAKVMFRKEFQSINNETALELACDALGDLVAMHDAALAFESTETAAIARMRHFEGSDASQTIPAVGNVRGHCKTFIQKADHFAAALLSIVRLFYPELNKKGWGNFQQVVKARYGEADPFYQVLELATPLLVLVRNTRDCLEHSNLKGVTTLDFEPEADGTIWAPSIEINFRKSKHDRCPVSWFMEQTTRSLLNCFEMIVVHSCAKCAQPFAGIPMMVGPLSDQYRTAWHVHFAYGMYNHEGQFVPCG